ncbi:MAG: STAS domain-containing protein [bacterium]
MAEFSTTDTGIALAGRLTVDTVTGVYNQTPEFSLERIEVDLSGIVEMDSAGLALLVHWKQHAGQKQCELQLSNPPEQVKTMVRISDLEALFEAG